MTNKRETPLHELPETDPRYRPDLTRVVRPQPPAEPEKPDAEPVDHHQV